MKSTIAIFLAAALTAGCATAPRIPRHKKPDFAKAYVAYLAAGDSYTKIRRIDSGKMAMTSGELAGVVVISFLLWPFAIVGHLLFRGIVPYPSSPLGANEYVALAPGERTVGISYSYGSTLSKIHYVKHNFEPGKLYVTVATPDIATEHVKFAILEAELKKQK